MSFVLVENPLEMSLTIQVKVKRSSTSIYYLVDVPVGERKMYSYVQQKDVNSWLVKELKSDEVYFEQKQFEQKITNPSQRQWTGCSPMVKRQPVSDNGGV